MPCPQAARRRDRRLGRARARDGARDMTATCSRVAAEQLPARTAGFPPAAGKLAASARGCMSPALKKFCGRPSATPDPAVTSLRCAHAAPIASRSSSASASTTTYATPSDAELIECAPDRLRALADCFVFDQANLPLRLSAEDAHEVRVRHRRQRMMPHRRVGEQRIADEQVALVDGASRSRETRGTRSSTARRARRADCRRPGRCCPRQWNRRSSNT